MNNDFNGIKIVERGSVARAKNEDIVYSSEYKSPKAFIQGKKVLTINAANSYFAETYVDFGVQYQPYYRVFFNLGEGKLYPGPLATGDWALAYSYIANDKLYLSVGIEQGMPEVARDIPIYYKIFLDQGD